MSIRSRLAGLALAAAAVSSLGLVSVPAATAAPAGAHQVAVQTKYFGMHLRLFDGPQGAPASRCYRNNPFNYAKSTCSQNPAQGSYDTGHAGEDAGFAGHHATIYYTTRGDGRTVLNFGTSDGQYYVNGTLPGRGSGDYTIDSINVPGKFGKVVSNKLNLNVVYEGPGLTGDAWQDFYLTGDVQVETSSVGGGAAGNPFAGLFGSS
ncbi:MAG: hypothetical protein PGN29_12725 [Gordonia paraffinivorans]